MNFTAVFALIFGIVLVFATQKFEGASLDMFIQPTAFFIVIGGSFCAILLNFNWNIVFGALKSLKDVFIKSENKSEQIIKEIVQISYFARKNGIFALQGLVDKVSDSFLARALQLALDLNNPQLLYDILTSEISYEEEEELINSRVFESLGGYAPTFGIVGAVMGLIQVMKDINNFELLGIGIATAFVSTLYGVGFANLIFLPIAGNLKHKTRERILLKEVMLQGVISIMMQENPAIVEEKLIAYLKYHNRKPMEALV
ncbi:MotA/TolQ/ExbB proton channel family protein [bacterium]|nr:MotA/TolQ/ExbB proton channel family protein [bacterium]